VADVMDLHTAVWIIRAAAGVGITVIWFLRWRGSRNGR
jgi:hypothetical protein